MTKPIKVKLWGTSVMILHPIDDDAKRMPSVLVTNCPDGTTPGDKLRDAYATWFNGRWKLAHVDLWLNFEPTHYHKG